MIGPPLLSRESRWLRLGGLGLMAVAMSAFAFVADGAAPQPLFRSAGRSAVTEIVLVAVSANAFAFGLVLLLAGLRRLSLLTNSHARRGALARMGGVNLMVLPAAVIALVALGSPAARSGELFDKWYVLPILGAFVVLARASVMVFRSGWKYEARTAEEALAADPRPAVLYLRSFAIDDQVLVPARGPVAWLARALTYTVSFSPEQEMAFVMERVGPVVAIGKPGERLPELGAARLYVGDDEWRQVVGRLMREAAIVVIRAGETANLWWEIEEARARSSPQRVIIVALGPQATLATFERRFAEAFGTPAAPPPPRSRALATSLRLLFPYGRAGGRIIYFDSHARPHEEPIVLRITWSGVLLSPYRPYRDSLQAAFRIVFAKLDLPWVPQRDLTTAVLLAFFGGWVGLHHFYMGRTRKGFWYLAFSWLVLPIVLGWIDAARLALLDDTQFQARLKVRTGGDSTDRW